MPQIAVRFNLHLEAGHRAGLRKGIVHFRQLPEADALLAAKIVQRAGTVRVHGVGRAAVDAVVVDEQLRGIHRAEAVVVIEHGVLSAVAHRAEEVAEIFVREGVGHDDALHFNRLQREAEDVANAGMRVVAVRNVDWHVDAVNIDVAVGVLRAERLVAEHRDETKLAGHLILTLHADVINLVRLRIREGHKLRAAAPDGRGAAVGAK